MPSGKVVALVASLPATVAVYIHRIRAEYAMLAVTLGATYAAYRREVGALIPFVRPG